jgi:hypothetical protein
MPSRTEWGRRPQVDLMTHSTALVISAQGLVNRFGNLLALDGLDLEV